MRATRSLIYATLGFIVGLLVLGSAIGGGGSVSAGVDLKDPSHVLGGTLSRTTVSANTIPFGIDFDNGLTVVIAGGTAALTTIVWN